MITMEKKQGAGIAVVTGASSGLGAVYAERLARRGYNLILVARRERRLEELAKDLRKQWDVDVNICVADLGSKEGVELVTDALSGNSEITMLVNNAGTSTMCGFAEMPVEKQMAMIHVNIIALMRLTNAVLPGFKERDRGTIINIGSVLGFHSFDFSSVYSGTKGFILNFTRGLQEELRGTHIVVQLVLPASTVSEIWEVAGFPLSNLDAATVMTTENCVDAALSGLDQGELITLPSVDDNQLQWELEQARTRLFEASQCGCPATRYRV